MSIQDEFAAIFAARADEIEAERQRKLEAAETREASIDAFMQDLFAKNDEQNHNPFGDTE